MSGGRLTASGSNCTSPSECITASKESAEQTSLLCRPSTMAETTTRKEGGYSLTCNDAMHQRAHWPPMETAAMMCYSMQHLDCAGDQVGSWRAKVNGTPGKPLLPRASKGAVANLALP
eukprot:4426296-Amphidinium_carterae.1